MPLASAGALSFTKPPAWHAIGNATTPSWTDTVPFSRPGPFVAAGIAVGGPEGATAGACPGAGGSGKPVPAVGGGPGNPGGEDPGRPAAGAAATAIPSAATVSVTLARRQNANRAPVVEGELARLAGR